MFWPEAREIGYLQGQAWEQIELSCAVRHNILINLGNTAPLVRQKQIVVIHDAGVFSTPDAYSWKFRFWYRFLHNSLIKNGSRIVTVSEFSRDDIIRHLHIKSSSISVISEGVDHMQDIVVDSTILSKHNLEPGRFVLSVGAAANHKNISALGLLAEKLKEQGVPLVIVGSPGGNLYQLTQPLKSACYTLRVSDGELKALYQNASCFVFPSRYEGFGLPTLEAMACGCPVVAADIASLREVCGDAALFCNPYSSDDIAVRVLNLLSSTHECEELKKKGEIHATKFTWAKAAKELDEIAGTL